MKLQNMTVEQIKAEIADTRNTRAELLQLMKDGLTEPEKILEYIVEHKEEEAPRNFNFTNTSIEALTPREKRTYYRDSGGASSVRGLGITVLPSGKKTFFVAATVDGKSRRIAIEKGKFPDMSARQARDKAQAILSDIADGHNPVAERKRQRSAAVRDSEITLKLMVETYISEKSLKPSTARQYRTRIAHEFAPYLNQPLTHITKDVVRKVNRERKERAGTAMRALRAVYAYAQAVYEDEKIFESNPFDIIKKTKTTHKYGTRESYIKAEELKPWMDAVDKLPELYRQYFLFLLMTGTRADTEAASLTWKDVNFKTKSFQLMTTKNGKTPELPIPQYMFTLLKAREGKGSELVFPIIDFARKYRRQVIKDSGVTFSRHDLRRTFLTIGESLDISFVTLKKLVNHSENADVTSGYIISNMDRLHKASQKIEDMILRKAKRLNADVDLFNVNQFA